MSIVLAFTGAADILEVACGCVEVKRVASEGVRGMAAGFMFDNSNSSGRRRLEEI